MMTHSHLMTYSHYLTIGHYRLNEIYMRISKYYSDIEL